MRAIRVGLYGTNGHQIHAALAKHPAGECVAVAAFDPALLPEALRERPGLKQYATLDDLLADDSVDLVSLCSPRRCDQAAEAIRCLEAGKHVYAEKPCAMSEAELDAIIAAAWTTGCEFHEMAGTAFEQPYLAMRSLVQSGALGPVIQVLVQKSYPYHAARPQNEDVDGGLLLQVGVHALRFVEHVGGVAVREIYALETQLGNPAAGELRMATSMMMRLANGGLASVICNYLNPPGFGHWGNEMLRVFGTEGFVEAVDGGARTRLVLRDHDAGPLDLSAPSQPYLDLYLASLSTGSPMPLTPEEELHPLRVLLRARHDAQARGLR